MGNNLKIPSKTAKQVIQGIVGKDQRKGWPIMQMSYLVNDWKYLKNLPAKNWFARKANFARSRVCRRGRNYMLHGMLKGYTKYPMSKESKEIKIAIIQ